MTQANLNTAAAPSWERWQEVVHRLDGLPLLPIGGGRDKKAPVDTNTGSPATGWETATYSSAQLLALPQRFVHGVGVRMGPDSGLIAVDLDGQSAIDAAIAAGCNPEQAATWIVRRTNTSDRLKVVWKLPAERWQQLKNTAKRKTDAREQIDVMTGANGGAQIIVLGKHKSGGFYCWEAGPEAASMIPPAWWALVLGIAAKPAPRTAAKPAPLAQLPAPDGRVALEALLSRDLEYTFRNGESEGGRNDATFRVAVGLLTAEEGARADGLAVHGDAETLVLDFAARCNPPLPEREALSCLESARRGNPTPDPGLDERVAYQRRQRRKAAQQPLQAAAASPPADAPARTAAAPTAPPTAPYRVLGWCADRQRIYYQHRQTGQIAAIKPAANANPLLQLAPIEWWETLYPSKAGINWAAGCSEVIEQANHAGVFAPDRVRGRGLWMEGDRVIWHLGDRLEVDGRMVELIEHSSTNHYPRLPALNINPAVEQLSDAAGEAIRTVVAAMGWSSPLDPIHLLGWVVLANVGGALEKRPVLQITSRFASGKTTTRERVLEPLLATLAISRSNSTEAGIRQLLRADTLPVLIDESEGEDHGRREGHLKLARLSFDGSPTDRGTTHGQALSYAIRSAVAMVGINTEIRNPAERSRTVVVGRQHLPQEEWAAVDRRLQEVVTTAAGAQLLRRAVSHLPTLRANVVTFRRAVEAHLSGGAAARAGDTYGALLAGAHLLTSTATLSDQEALNWLDAIGWSAGAALGESAGTAEDGNAEGRQCLAHLLSHEEPWRTDTGTGRLSVRELIELARTPSGANDAEQARKALGRRGIRATDCGLEVVSNAEPLDPIFQRTKWSNGSHRARLLDLEGAYSVGMARFPALGAKRALKLPWELLA